MSWKMLLVVAVLGCGSNNKAGSDGNSSGSDGGLHDGVYLDADPACTTPGVLPAMKAETVISTGLTQPLWVAQPPGSTDLFIVQKTGQIKILRNGALLATDFLDVSDINIPSAQAEGGLLSMAFHPSYATNGRFFIYANVTENNLAVVREYARSANPDVATATPVGDLISQPNDGNGNVGGTIAFGPDNYLYVSTGDGGNPPDSADLTSHRGKILRVDVDHPTVAPPGNLGGNADPFIWDYGLRNPFRVTFDRKTHELYIADAGDAKFEEVDIEQPGVGNKDYGWPRWEGDVCHDDVTSCPPPGTNPQYVRAHQTAFSVIIGGSVYRGSALPCLRGNYVYGIYGSEGHILTWSWNGTSVSPEVDLTDMFNIDNGVVVAINEDQQGELYIVTLDGKIYKIVPA